MYVAPRRALFQLRSYAVADAPNTPAFHPWKKKTKKTSALETGGGGLNGLECLFFCLCLCLFSQRNTFNKDSLQLLTSIDLSEAQPKGLSQLFHRNRITPVMWVRISLGTKRQAEWRGEG